MADLLIRIGCAGWSIPKDYRDVFCGSGTHLERYAEVLPAVEINSCFYRPHMPKTYRRWAACTPEDFRFAVKMRNTITHEKRLNGVEDDVAAFVQEVTHLGSKLRTILVQFPPSFGFDPGLAVPFFIDLREQFAGPVVCEPRHGSWFTPDVDALLREFRISRAAVDPAPHGTAARPGGFPEFAYFRLHGSPRMYYSGYSDDFLDAVEEQIAEHRSAREIWCIFDNTALGHAWGNALDMLSRVHK